MPNLRHLYIKIKYSELIDGHQWEQIIRNYLPKLKTFRLKMSKTLFLEQNIQERVDRLVDSFRSSFWIDEHQWFVRCFIKNRIVYFFTLSDRIIFCESICHSWKSTYPHDNQQEFYNNITEIFDETFFDRPISSDIRLPNINYLQIKFPINNRFWSIVPSLNQLKTLSIFSYADTFQSQLQTLLNQAPHLHILRIRQDPSLPLQMSLFKYRNASVRKLHLYDYDHCFNEEECFIFSRSPLGAQCEVLSIQLNNPKTIIYLVNNMINLRALFIDWKDDKNFVYLKSTKNNDERRTKTTQTLDQLVQWLKVRLPSTCLILNDPYYVHNISIWI
jgi:hypothetical protein